MHRRLIVTGLASALVGGVATQASATTPADRPSSDRDTKMAWAFDQAPDVACITYRSIIDGAPVLVVTHYEDDHSWSFLDGQPYDQSSGLVVAMSTVLERHPTLTEVADLPPGWTATRRAADQPWTREMDEPSPDDT